MTSIIDAYIAGYARELDYYQEAARLAAQCCEALLRRNGIRGIVTHRAKRPDRLRDKLLQRAAERKAAKRRAFKTIDDIRRDIIDLSGVRIALYFPGDRERLSKLIEDQFEVRKTKNFPEKGKKRAGKRFDGYHATHFHVNLREDSVATPDERYLSATIEIQVASVLMHAWSEVEHDMIYKPLTGELSEDELAILDELNGMVIAGEIALERLQRAVELRVAKENARFSNPYELAAYLADESRAVQLTHDLDLAMGDVRSLLDLLRAAELDRPNSLTPLLDAIREVSEERPVADQLADMVLAEHPDLYSTYASAQSRLQTLGLRTTSTSDEVLGEFLARWLVIERFIRALSEMRGVQSAGRIIVPNRKLLSELLEDSELIARLDWARMLRNRIVHDYGKMSRSEIAEALKAVNYILGQLQASNDPQIQQAMQQAL